MPTVDPKRNLAGLGKQEKLTTKARTSEVCNLLLLYDENMYLAALARRGSPLSSVLTVTAATL
jgi:hypothetical protein